MSPNNTDASEHSEAAWGIGARGVFSVPQWSDLVAANLGLELTNLMSHTEEFFDPVTHLRVEQQTHQSIFRLFLGGEVGFHGHRFLRPHAGLNVALTVYSIGTDVVIPNDVDPENEIRQNYDDESQTVLGWDATLGADLNFYQRYFLDVGVRYIKAFSVPQQLGEGAKKIYPDYFQIYIGLGFAFSTGDEDEG